MKDHNKEIRNLTGSANNLNEQGGPWPGGTSLSDLWELIQSIYLNMEKEGFLQWVADNPDDDYVKAMKWVCKDDETCWYALWVAAGKPRPAPEITPTAKPSKPEHPLQRDRYSMQAPSGNGGGGIG